MQRQVVQSSLQPHLQKVQGSRVVFEQKAIQHHPLADKLHYLLLGVENIGSLLLVRALGELCLVGAEMVKVANICRQRIRPCGG